MPLASNDTVFCSVPLGNLPFLDLLEPVSSAGFSTISMMPTQLEALTARGMTQKDFRQRLADHGLRVSEFECVAHWLSGQAAAADRVAGYGTHLLDMTADKVIPMAASVGAQSVSVVEIFNIDIDIDQAAEAFARICDKAADYGLNANIEFLPAGGIKNIATTAEIVRRSGRANAGITLDTLHFYRGGSTIEDLAVLPATMIGLVQLSDAKQATTDNIEHEMMTGRVLPGQGKLDIRGIVETLDSMGVTAPVGVEVFSDLNASDPVEQTARGWMAALRSMTKRA